MRHNPQFKHLFLLGAIVMTGLLLLAACGGTPAPKTYTIGIATASPALEKIVTGFKEGMTELGYVEGTNVTYIYDGPTDMD